MDQKKKTHPEFMFGVSSFYDGLVLGTVFPLIYPDPAASHNQ
jgi:hypothetical protein